jgi:hypothetical protein
MRPTPATKSAERIAMEELRQEAARLQAIADLADPPRSTPGKRKQPTAQRVRARRRRTA